MFKVTGVNDDNIHIPEVHEIPLIELWPTKVQENNALNVEKTAEWIDKLRFFYTNIWMPWDRDNDDSQDWNQTHLITRLQFYFDLHSKRVDRFLSEHIRGLIAEARYLQNQRYYLEIGMSDDDEEDIIKCSNTDDKNHGKDLLNIHLKMNNIKNELEMLQNPEMRKLYREIKFEGQTKRINPLKREFFIVSIEKTKLTNQIKYLESLQTIIGSIEMTHMTTTLQEALNNCFPCDTIIIPSGCHTVKFYEHLNGNGSIKGLLPITGTEPPTVITSKEDDNTLLKFDGDFLIENCTFDCRNVRVGLIIRSGTLTLRNCNFYGDETMNAQQAIVVLECGQLNMEKCSMKNFATGISLNSNAKTIITDSVISDCRNGIEMKDRSIVDLNSVRIIDCLEYGIVFETVTQLGDNEKRLIVKEVTELEKYKEFLLNGDNILLGNKQGKAAVLNIKKSSEFQLALFNDSGLMEFTENENGEQMSDGEEDTEEELSSLTLTSPETSSTPGKDDGSIILIDDSINE